MDKVEQYRKELREWIELLPLGILSDLVILKDTLDNKSFWGTISFSYQAGKSCTARVENVIKKGGKV